MNEKDALNLTEDRLVREQRFHDERFSGDDDLRQGARKFYVVNQHVRERYFEIVAQHGAGKALLEYGCGSGGSIERWQACGVDSVTGIDISPEGIKKARVRAKALGLPAAFFVMNAEQTEFADDAFDIVVGAGILHHLDLNKAYAELRRILRPGGHAVFIEPLGHNPLINFYRARTPQMRTADEHPLLMSDLTLLRRFFHHVDLEFYGLFTLGAVPFRKTPLFGAAYRFLKAVDALALRAPGLQRHAWTVIMHASSPRKA